jgi:hypothetical protein
LSGKLRRVLWWKFTDVSEVHAPSIIRAMIFLMMEAVSTSETSVNFHQSTNIPEDSQTAIFEFLTVCEPGRASRNLSNPAASKILFFLSETRNMNERERERERCGGRTR